MAPCTQAYANMTGVHVGWCLWESSPPDLERELRSADWAVIADQPKRFHSTDRISAWTPLHLETLVSQQTHLSVLSTSWKF